FSSRRRHTRSKRDWSSDVCSSDLLLASGAGPRTSLGYAGAKYEMGLEHIEQVEVVTAELAAREFNASFAEVRVPSGAMANLFAFRATSRPGQTMIASPARLGGRITHHAGRAAGMLGLARLGAAVDAGGRGPAIA